MRCKSDPGHPHADVLGFLEEHVVDTVSLIWDALPVISDGRSRSGVERVLHRCLKSEIFFKSFAGAVVKHGMHVRGKSESYYVLKWISILLSRLSLPESQKAISKLLQVAARCLDQLLERDFRRAARKLKSFISESLPFRQAALGVVSEMGSPALLRLVCETVSASEQEPMRAKLLTDYCTNILAAKTAPSQETTSAYQSLLGSLTKNEFGDVLLPALTRSLRRNPEVVLNLALHLFRVMHLDVSTFGLELQKVMLQFIRHTNSDVQSMAVNLQSHMAKLISDRDVLQQMVETFVGILSGKAEGKIKSIHERVALAKALGVLATSPSKRNDQSQQITTSISTLYEHEG